MTTFRELICSHTVSLDKDYDAWLDRLRRENRESERQREEARMEAEQQYELERSQRQVERESDYDRAMRHRVEVD